MVWDGFIDQYMLDEMGPEGVDIGSMNEAQKSTLAMELMTPPAQQAPAAQQPLSAQTLLQAQPQQYSGPQMPDTPDLFERNLNPRGYEREMGRYNVEKNAYDQQQQALKMQQFAAQTKDPMLKRALLSGVPAIQSQAIKQMYGSGNSAVDFNQYSQMSPEKRAAYAQFKNPNPRAESATEFFQRDPSGYSRMQAAGKPLVNVDNSMKYPDGRMLTDKESSDFGLSTNASYWLKGDGSAPQKVGNFSEAQTKAANFGNHMIEANKNIDRLMNVEMFNPSVLQQNLDRFGAPDAFAHLARTDAGTQYEASKREWLMAHLRKDSGAAITRDDMMQANKSFFPVPGDSQQAVQRKAEARAREQKGTVKQSGGAYQDFFKKDIRNFSKDTPAQPAQRGATELKPGLSFEEWKAATGRTK